MVGNCTNRAFGEALVLHVESAIEAGSKIFPGDCRGQLDELLVAEVLAKSDHLFIGRCGWRIAERDGVVEHVPFEFVECVARAMIADTKELIFGDAFLSADGRADIESEQTPDHRSDFQRSQVLDLGIKALRTTHCELETDVRPHHGAVSRHQTKRLRNGAAHLGGGLEDSSGEKSGFFVLDTFDSRHAVPLLSGISGAVFAREAERDER